MDPGAAENAGDSTLTCKCKDTHMHTRAATRLLWHHRAMFPGWASGPPGSCPALPERPGPGLAVPAVLSGQRGGGGTWTCPSELPGAFPGASSVRGSPRTLDRGQGVSRGQDRLPHTQVQTSRGKRGVHGARKGYLTGCDPPRARVCVHPCTHLRVCVHMLRYSQLVQDPSVPPTRGPPTATVHTGWPLITGDPGPARPAPGMARVTVQPWHLRLHAGMQHLLPRPIQAFWGGGELSLPRCRASMAGPGLGLMGFHPLATMAGSGE